MADLKTQAEALKYLMAAINNLSYANLLLDAEQSIPELKRAEEMIREAVFSMHENGIRPPRRPPRGE